MATQAEINVTPLIDICLVLLITFLVITPLLGRTEVPLPAVRDPHSLAGAVPPITLTIRRDGGIVWEGRSYSLAEITRTIDANRWALGDRDLVVEADRGLPYRDVLAVMNALRLEHDPVVVGLATTRRGA